MAARKSRVLKDPFGHLLSDDAQHVRGILHAERALAVTKVQVRSRAKFGGRVVLLPQYRLGKFAKWPGVRRRVTDLSPTCHHFSIDECAAEESVLSESVVYLHK